MFRSDDIVTSSRLRVKTRWVTAIIGLLLALPVSADDVYLRPSRQFGQPFSVSVSNLVNPLYINIFLTAGMLREAKRVAINIQPGGRHVFEQDEFAAAIARVPDATPVVFGKNITMSHLDRRPLRVVGISVISQNGRPLGRNIYRLKIDPHPSEVITREVNQAIFEDIASTDFENACMPKARMKSSSISNFIFIGEQEQKFPPTAHLNELQRRGSLEGYLRGCKAAYNKCADRIRMPVSQGNINNFCMRELEKLKKDIF